MKLFTYKKADDPHSHIGLFIETINEGIDLQHAYILFEKNRDPGIKLAFSDMISLISSSEALLMAQKIYQWIQTEISGDRKAFAAESALFALHRVQILAPIPRPPSIRDFITFETHVRQSIKGVMRFLYPRIARLNGAFEKVFKKSFLKPPRLWYQIPAYYKGNPGSVAGHLADIEWPAFTQYLDYELEIGVYIGKQGRNISKEHAQEYIAGYTIYNDYSARDLQVKEMQLRLGPTKSKDFDTGNVMGPFLVTPDELQDPYDIVMIARVNGDEWSRGNSRDMYYCFEDLIAYVSQYETLYPGDFFGSGTVGNGCGLEHGRWLKPGDIVELEVRGLGILQNKITRKQQAYSSPVIQ